MAESKRILVTGGAGFIGSALVRRLIRQSPHQVCVFDKLTYAGNLASLAGIAQDSRFEFVRADICDAKAVRATLHRFRPDVVMHLAAESHVDRSIDGPAQFIQTNVVGTYVLLHAAQDYRWGLSGTARDDFRFLHISTTKCSARSARKVSSARTALCAQLALFRLEGRVGSPGAPPGATLMDCRRWRPIAPTITGRIISEKLIPLMILNALERRPLPVYGRGENVRDWLFVDDHVEALLSVVEKGRVGETYNIGGVNEQRNIDVVHMICDLVDEMRPDGGGDPRRQLGYLCRGSPRP